MHRLRQQHMRAAASGHHFAPCRWVLRNNSQLTTCCHAYVITGTVTSPDVMLCEVVECTMVLTC
jgi:hypothetical protein